MTLPRSLMGVALSLSALGLLQEREYTMSFARL